MSTIRLIGIDAPNFEAGLVIHNGRVSCAPPVIKYMVGWSDAKVLEYCNKKGWHYETMLAQWDRVVDE